MPPADIEQATQDLFDAASARSFPEWTTEDDSDVEIASVAEEQRRRFRAASVAGRQQRNSRYRAPLRELPAILTRGRLSQEAHEIRAVLEDRKFRHHAAKGRGRLGAATSGFTHVAAEAVGAVAGGLRHSADAAAGALADGKGIVGAVGAVANSAHDSFNKGVDAVASAVRGVQGPVASASTRTGSSESESSGNESTSSISSSISTTSTDEPAPKTQQPPPPILTSNPPPQISDAPASEASLPPAPATSTPPPPPPPPPQQTNAPPSPSESLDPPKPTSNPIDNLPPPKAEQPSSVEEPSSSESESATLTPIQTTTSEEDARLSLSTIVPGATPVAPSDTRVTLTPVLTSPLPAMTSDGRKGTAPDTATTPVVVAPAPTTLSTSISTTSSLGRPPTLITPSQPDSDRDGLSGGGGGGGGGGSRGGLSGGQDAVISIAVLFIVICLLTLGYYLWRKGKKRVDSDHGGSFRAMMEPQLEKAKQGLTNVAGKIPYIRDKLLNKESWGNVDDPHKGRLSEKIFGSFSLSRPAPPQKDNDALDPIRVQTTFMQTSSFASPFNAEPAIGATVSSVGLSAMGVSTFGEGQSTVTEALGAASASKSNLSPFADPGDVEAQAAPQARRASQTRQLVGTTHGPKPSLSSITPQYNLTLLSTMTGGGRRMSDMSSLSSGFGDGDIVVPPRQARKSTRASKMNNVTNSGDLEDDDQQQTNPRHSTATTVATNGRRDTVYTEASEDSMPRFRTVSSWVRQQSGRVKRAKQREQAAADESGTPPPVPPIPPEQEFRLMMPDGEVPRRVEDTDGADWSRGSSSNAQTMDQGGVIGTAR